MVIGMLPLALARGAGAEWKNGMAWVLIGGYVIIDKLKDRLSAPHEKAEIIEPSLNLT